MTSREANEPIRGPITPKVLTNVRGMLDNFLTLFGGWFNWDPMSPRKEGMRAAKIRNYTQWHFVSAGSTMLRTSRLLAGERIQHADSLGVIHKAHGLFGALDRSGLVAVLNLCSQACKIVARRMLDNGDNYSWTVMVSDKDYDYIQEAMSAARDVIMILDVDTPGFGGSTTDRFVVINDGFSIVGRRGYTAGVGWETVPESRWHEHQEWLRKAYYGAAANSEIIDGDAEPEDAEEAVEDDAEGE